MFDLLFTYATVATVAGDSPFCLLRDPQGSAAQGVVGLGGTTRTVLSTCKRSGVSALAVDRHGRPFRCRG